MRLAYATSGVGPVLLKTANWLTHLEHDWDSPVWRHWLRELSWGHQLVRYDERGNGLSDRDPQDLSFEAWVGDLETVVDELGVESFPLVGISQGCAVAVTYAARHPGRVTRLILYGGYALGRLRRARTAGGREEAEAVIRGGGEGLLPGGLKPPEDRRETVVRHLDRWTSREGPEYDRRAGPVPLSLYEES